MPGLKDVVIETASVVRGRRKHVRRYAYLLFNEPVSEKFIRRFLFRLEEKSFWYVKSYYLFPDKTRLLVSLVLWGKHKYSKEFLIRRIRLIYERLFVGT